MPRESKQGDLQTKGVSRNSRKGERRREEILQASRAILVEEGWEAFSLREVATRLGIRHGHLQYYFPTKQDLLVAIYDAEVSTYTALIEKVARKKATRADLIRQILNQSITTAQRPETELFFIAAALAHRDPEMAAILERDNKVYRDSLSDAFAVIAPEMPTKRRELLARFVQTLVDGLSLQHLTDDAASTELRHLVRLVTDVTVQLFQESPSRPGSSRTHRER